MLFGEHFLPTVNVIHERARFHARNQKPEENIEQYVRALYELAQKANFADEEEAIRDRLALGVCDPELSEKLQLKADLTLDTAVKQARQYETVKSQLSEQRQTNVDAVYPSRTSTNRGGSYGGRRNNGRPGFARGGGGGRRGGSTSSGVTRGSGNTGIDNMRHTSTCSKCGRNHRDFNTCTARGRKYIICSRMNHFAAVCRTKSVYSIQDADAAQEEETEHFLGAVNTGETLEPPWTTTLTLGGQEVKSKTDTGADVSVISTSQYKKLNLCPPLQKISSILRSPGGVMQCEGQFVATTTVHDESHSLRLFVANMNADNLLSREAALRMA